MFVHDAGDVGKDKGSDDYGGSYDSTKRGSENSAENAESLERWGTSDGSYEQDKANLELLARGAGEDCRKANAP